MRYTIYTYELKFWSKQASIYFYALFFFAVATVTMWGMGSEANFEQTGQVLNSARNIIDFSTRRFFFLLLFILPGIIGYSVFRDYKSGMHSLLYSFPFSKRDYLLGKFLSAFTVSTIIGGMILLGFMLGFSLAGGVENHLLVFDVWVYLQAFFVFILPNLFFFGVFIFGLVTFSRNIYVGYIGVVVLILTRQIIGILVGKLGNEYLSALLEPMGVNAIRYTTKLWTIAEQNQNQLVLDGVILHNRLLWISLGLGIFVWIYRSFSFSQQAASFSFKKAKPIRKTKVILGSINKVILPKIQLDFSLKQQIKTTFNLGWTDFKYIINSWMFVSIVIIGGLTVIFIISSANPMFGTKSLPTTAQMLSLPMMFFSGIINLLTFLYTGMLIHRAYLAKTNQLVDISPLPNWVFLSSKILAITLMQIVLLSLLMFGGIFSQLKSGYYHLEIGHYIFELYGLNMIHFMLWTFLAVFVQSLFDNPYLGFFVLILVVLAVIFIGEPAKMLGFPVLAEASLRFNQVPGPPPVWLQYSAMDGYGTLLETYLIYKAYWLLAGMLLLVASVLFWRRGLTHSFKERWQLAKSRFHPKMMVFSSIICLLFLGTGYTLFQDSYYSGQQLSETERKRLFHLAEKKYNRYKTLPQPTIKSVNIDMDIYPKSRSFKAKGSYLIINETTAAIDTLVLSYLPHLTTKYAIKQDFQVVSQENIADYLHIDILYLPQILWPGDSLEMTFSCQNPPNTFLHKSSIIKGNGTYIEDDIFLQLGNWTDYIRENKGWSSHQIKAHPSDSTAWHTKNQHFINFETTISTSDEQIAIAPGRLVKSWQKGDRKYFHYKTDQIIGHSFLFTSGDCAVKKGKWRDVDLEIYYHKNHPYNIDRIMAGKKAALRYCADNFSPYPFKQLRTIEFAQSGKASAHSFPMAIPTGEKTGFIADIDDSEMDGTDFAFGTSVHETAHQWWGNMLIPSDVRGFKMVAESMAEYVNVMVKKHEKGEQKLRHYLHENMAIYLKGRTYDHLEEQALAFTYPEQNYIHYPKGAVVFYALSEYIGEDNLNRALAKYIQQVDNKEIPATSIAMLDKIKEVTPDSLQYLIEDMFETVTLYDNRIQNVTSKLLPNGKYQVDIEFLVSKYRSTGKGERSYQNTAGDSLHYQTDEMDKAMFSYPLADYIEIGVFEKKELNGETKETELYLVKHKITTIYNKISLILDKKPTAVGVDPYIKLIDLDKKDNRRKIITKDQR